MRIGLSCFALAGLLAAGARRDRWELVGPGGGGSMFAPTVSPHDPARVLLFCDMTGSYISDDAGENWRMFNLRSTSSLFVFDPIDPGAIYTGGLGLWRSTDSGGTWSLVYPNPDNVTGVKMAGDHAEETILVSGPAAGRVNALAVDPANPRTLYAAINGALRVSADWGATWGDPVPLAETPRKIWVDPASPAGDRTLYIAGTSRILVREGGVWRMGTAPEGVTSLTDVSAGFPPEGGPPVIYAVANRILISPDGGATWQDAAPLPGANTRFGAAATSLMHPDVVYVSYSNLTEPDGRYWFGVARSEDRGASWTLVWKSANQGAANIEDAWLPGAYGAGWAGPPIAIGVSPTNPDVCYTTDSGRAMRTTDGGKTWRALYSARMPDGGYTTTGLDVTTNYGLHFDPFDSSRIFISFTDIGLFRSESGGSSWKFSAGGVPRAWQNTTYWMAFDPDVPGRVWAAMSKTHDLPRPKMWRSASVASYDGGVALSEDGGKTWRVSSDGMAPTAATHILLDPTSPPDARVLWATGFGRGAYKSVDGGAHWELKNNGIEGNQPLAWRMARDPNGVLYLIVARRSERGTYGDENDGALYRSEDGGESWSKLALPPGVNGPNGLAIDPDDPSRLYLAVWGRYNSAGDRDGGIFLSMDGGASWTNVFSGDQHVYDVTIDARNGALYAAGFESSAWRSEDRGATWQRIRGYNFKWGHRVISDPADASRIYIMTFGGGVWHGPAGGDPDAPEDIAAPEPLRFTR